MPLVREASVRGGKALRRGALLPQGVFPVFHLRLYPAAGSARLRLRARFVCCETASLDSRDWGLTLTRLLRFHLAGKLYCQLHFDRLKNGPNLQRNLSFRSVSL